MISCQHHDYIEIVCAYKYPIKLTMKSGVAVECTALDVCLNEDRVECIKVKERNIDKLIVLDDISILEVCVENPHFDSIVFT